MKKIGLIILAVLLALTLYATVFQSEVAPVIADEPAPEIDPNLEAAFQARIQSNETKVLAFVLYEIRIVDVQYSSDGSLALLWLGMVEPETGELVVGEPGLAIAQLQSSESKSPQDWAVTLQADTDWATQLDQVPVELLDEDARQPYVFDEGSKSSIQAVFSGYKLPWAAGTARRVSQSVSHINTTCTGSLSCLYAFDFASNSPDQDWPILASKGGTVVRYRTNVPTRTWNLCPGDGTTGNYVVLKDESTNPTTYQLYLHMAADSFPENLREAGAVVKQGDFLGTVDNTGASCGSHLHFMVHTNAASYWGTSVDITFDDVTVNGGRPRTKTEATSSTYSQYGNQYTEGNYYTSGNQGSNPPTASINYPQANTVISTSTVLVRGTASDDQQVNRVQVIYRAADGTWKNVGDAATNAPIRDFAITADFCAAGIPAGDVELAVRVWDNHGNMSIQPQGQRTVHFNAACVAPTPTPAPCTPGPNKIILYSDANYQGTCREYVQSGTEILVPSLEQDDTKVGSDNTASIQVGANSRLVAFEGTNYTGRNQSFESSDPDLSDNIIGADTISSLKLQPRNLFSMGEPEMVEPAEGAVYSSGQSILVRAQNSSTDAYGIPGAVEYQLSVYREDDGTFSYVNLKLETPWASIGSLPPGKYNTRLIGINHNTNADIRSAASSYVHFTVTDGSQTSQAASSIPYTDLLTTGSNWQADGLWIFTNPGWRYGNGTSYAGTGANSGSLTSPAVKLGSEDTPYLCFDYRYQTEGSGPVWDQRRIQISADGGLFQDLANLPQVYGESPVSYQTACASLKAFVGKTVQVRFYFNTIDANSNTGLGWEIKGMDITNDPPGLLFLPLLLH